MTVVTTDMSTCKIYNANLIRGIKIIGIALLCYFIATVAASLGYLRGYSLHYAFYGNYIVHIIVSVLAGFLLWYAEVWPAGDAKFFIVMAAGIPMAAPHVLVSPYQLFFQLLINIFLSASVWCVGSFLSAGFYSASPGDYFSEIWKDILIKLKSFKASATGINMIAAGISVLTLLLIQRTMGMVARTLIMRFISDTGILFFMMFVLWDKIAPFFRNKWWIYFTVTCYGLYLTAGWFFFRPQMWELIEISFYNMLKFSALLIVGRKMIGFLLEKADIVDIGPDELQPGMVLSTKATAIARGNPKFHGEFDDFYKDGLSVEQTDMLKQWMKDLKIDSPKVEIVKGKPFAMWIFFGAALSITVKYNFAVWLIKVGQWW